MGQLITTATAAEILKVSPVRVRQFIASGALKSEMHGRDHLLDEDEVKHFHKHGRRKTGRPRKTK
jgi:excisionase family DNA binding protein